MNVTNATPEKIDDALWALNIVGRKSADWMSPQDMRDHILSLDQLPPLAEIARRLLELKGDPSCDAQKLTSVIEMDPGIAAQIVRWGSAPIHGFRSTKPVTVRDAINIVLGFDRVFNLAFGLCSLTPLQAPKDGPLGKRAFWRQTMVGMELLNGLVGLMDSVERPPAAQLQLTYLLHNTGHLLLAHLFAGQFQYLSDLVDANPDMPVLTIERYALGVDHAKLGCWLMQGWAMPQILQDVCLHHHNPHYRGAGERLVWLICLADRLLGQIGIGDARNEALDDLPLFSQLRIDQAKALEVLERLGDKLEDLDQAVTALVDR